jgi:hypothetical protein
MKYFWIILLLAIAARAQTHITTGKADITNAGSFTGSSRMCYLCTSINGWTQGSFNSIFLPNVLDAVSGGVTIPVGATVGPNAEGVAGYVVNQADTRSGAPGAPTGSAGFQSNGVSLYGISQAYNNFSSAWGINTTTADNTSTNNTFLVGYEADMWVLGTPFTLYGMDVTLNGNTGTVPGGSFGYNISNSRTDGGKWTIGFDANDNCCATALSVGTAAPKAPSVASQNVSWCRYDSGSVRHCDDFIAEDALGNLNVTVATNRFVNVPALGVAGSIVLNSSKGQHIQTQAANNDLAGNCTSASGTTCTVSFTAAYANAPICVATPFGNQGAWYINTISTTGFQITYANSGGSSFFYICMGNPN